MRRRTCLGALTGGFPSLAKRSGEASGDATTAADEAAFALNSMRAGPGATRVQCALNESSVAEHRPLGALRSRGRCGESSDGSVRHCGGRSRFGSVENPSANASATESA